MTNSAVGRLERVPLRDVWPHEAHALTPWLLANADVLADVLGMDLELSAAEHPVGQFSLDLVGVVRGTDEVVIVENQLEPSDHTHLGQILTYAGGTDASHIVWVAPRFRDEHRAALEWLNARTDTQTRFFAVQIDAVRIGTSLPAPLMELVVRPNDWEKTVKASTAPARTRKWARLDVLDALTEADGALLAESVESMLDGHLALGPAASLYWGEGASPSVTAVYQGANVRVQPWTIWIRGGRAAVSINYEYMAKEGGPSSDALERVVAALAVLPGVAQASQGVADAGWKKRPAVALAPLLSFPTALLTWAATFEAFYRDISA
ncbi:hypothetical protein ASE38_16955 [Cellulomonas sp. Root930]|nr:hypothetical protein ASE38_16955 [Cellulomonas sp. Root930]